MSKERILQQIAAAGLTAKPAPDLAGFLSSGEDTEAIVKQFSDRLVAVGGSVLHGNTNEVDTLVRAQFPNTEDILFVLQENGAELMNEVPTQVEVAVLRGSLAVAENGAVWVKNLPHRSLPVIAEHLVLLLDSTQIVQNMHDAYAKLGPISGPYSAFISGPSKTADIEQSLVIGAQGARSLLVILLSA